MENRSLSNPSAPPPLWTRQTAAAARAWYQPPGPMDEVRSGRPTDIYGRHGAKSVGDVGRIMVILGIMIGYVRLC
jgi:hypothetical protein